MENEGWRGGADVRRSSLLRLGEFHSVADDLDSLLLRTGSVCRGRFTVEDEHLPAPERTQHTHTHTHTFTQRNPETLIEGRKLIRCWISATGTSWKLTHSLVLILPVTLTLQRQEVYRISQCTYTTICTICVILYS